MRLPNTSGPNTSGTKTFNDYGLHSYDGKPAIIGTNGDKFWYKNGKRHRDGDKPASIYKSGDKQWYKDGRLHRIRNPAIVGWNSYNEYWLEGTHISGDDIPTTEEDWTILVLKLNVGQER